MARLGAQKPTFEVVGDYARTDGPEIVSTLAAYGFEFDEAQAHQLDLYAAKDATGAPAAMTIGLSEPRQNGKSHAARWFAVWRAAICGMQVVYSAHNGDVVADFFKMLDLVFTNEDNYPDFHAMLDGEPYRQPGRQEIRFTSGGRIRFSTRTNSKSRGGTCSMIVIDEAQELTDAQLNALLPTTAASPDGVPQTIYIGTPPDPTCAGTVFRRLHDEAHSDPAPDTWWMEWAVDELPKEDADLDELMELAYATNPALGTRINERTVRNEARTMGLDGLARERFGWWKPGGTQAPPLIDPAKWEECLVADEDAMRDGIKAFGVKFSPDGQTAALSVALAQKGGAAYVELIEVSGTSRGTDGLADWLLARAGTTAALAIDGKSGTAPLVKRLLDRGYPRRALVECSPADAQASVAMLLDEVNAGTVSHIASPALDESATRSIKRKIGSNGGFGFGDGPGSISCPVESAALALWAARTTRRDPKRKQRAW
nr:MAG TPA: Large Terminase [Caudoviricetes sp.]